MAYRNHRQTEGSESGAKDVRKTPGKPPKPPPMGAKRKIAPKKRPA